MVFRKTHKPNDNDAAEKRKKEIAVGGSQPQPRVKTFSRQPRILWVSVSPYTSSYSFLIFSTLLVWGSRSPLVREIACDIHIFLCFPKKIDLNAFQEFWWCILREEIVSCDVKDIEKGIFEFFSYLWSFFSFCLTSIARVSSWCFLGVTNSNGMWQVIEIVWDSWISSHVCQTVLASKTLWELSYLDLLVMICRDGRTNGDLLWWP